MVFPLAHRGSPALRWFAIGQQQDWVHQLLPRRDSLLRGLRAEEHQPAADKAEDGGSVGQSAGQRWPCLLDGPSEMSVGQNRLVL
jgi:hypothetical protein